VAQKASEATFRDVCSPSRKWFRGGENCFVAAFPTKHSGRNCEYFQCAENARISVPEKFREQVRKKAEWFPEKIALKRESGAKLADLRLLAGRREQIAAAANGADHCRLGWVRLDLAADTHDAQVHGPVEGLAVAGIGQLQEPFPRQNPFRIGGEHLEQA